MINLPLITAAVNGSQVSLLSLAWHFFADSNPFALISTVASYYQFDVEVHTEFPGRVAISMPGIIGGVVRDRDPVAKIKLRNYSLACFLQKFPAIPNYVPAKISRYTELRTMLRAVPCASVSMCIAHAGGMLGAGV